MDEVDVHAVDLGRELGQGVELRLGLAPVVVGLPVARELLNRRQLHALRPICDHLPEGRRVAVIRRRSWASFSSGVSTWKGRMSVAVWAVVLITASVVGRCGSGCPPLRFGNLGARLPLPGGAHQQVWPKPLASMPCRRRRSR